MPEFSKKLDFWADRVTDRLMRWIPGQRIQVPTSKPIVSFTFDDVPETALTHGAAILEKHGVRGTFYIAGSLEGRREPNRTLINREGCRTLAAQGHEIGCHTFSHTRVSDMALQELEADLEQSKEYLDNIAPQRRKRNFAYPYNAGSFGARHTFEMRFRSCRAGGERINRGAVNSAFLYGVEIRQPESHAQGLKHYIDAVVAQPGWIIFFTHDIARHPTPYGCTPETFDDIVRYAIAQGCLVLPVGDVLDQIGTGRL